MLSLALCAACLTLSLPVRICPSMFFRMLPFSTSTQCFAVGTNQLRAAARSLMLVPSRFVAFGMFPFAWRPFSDAVLVKSLIQSEPMAAFPVTGTARSEPPRKPGSGLPFTWLGRTNCAVVALYFAPTQQLYQLGPTITPALPCA